MVAEKRHAGYEVEIVTPAHVEWAGLVKRLAAQGVDVPTFLPYNGNVV